LEKKAMSRSTPIPEDLVYMKKRPGKYAIPLSFMTYLNVEVDEHGNVHQLKPDGVTRDGILRDDGWMGDFKAFTVSVDGKEWIRVSHPEHPIPVGGRP
jgi:hypothetical protein